MASSLVQTISLSGAQNVPPRFHVPHNERPLPTQKSIERLPLIDLAGLDHHSEIVRQETMQALARACEDWGFFQVINHGMEVSVIEETRKAARQFFELPLEEKMKYEVKHESDPKELVGYGHTRFFKGGDADDWMDSLFGFVAPPTMKQIERWPNNPTHLRDAVERYGKAAEKLLQRLLQLMAVNLGDRQVEEEFGGFHLFLRANFYPPCPEPDLVLGTHSHTDHGCLTILLQDKEMDGLQVRKNDCWFSVDPIPNALVINIGDQLTTYTKGKYKSAEHRGIVNNKATIMTLVAHLDPPGSHHSCHGEKHTEHIGREC